jgi:hypothetical protein
MAYLAFKYAVFAATATFVNLGTQYFSLLVYNGNFGLYLAIALGTITGLFTKYILDKNHIFYHAVSGVKDDFKKFVLYSLMGVITTLIFWGFELGFDAIFKFDFAKYLGAVIGLTIGYVIKYNLDKNYVFK